MNGYLVNKSTGARLRKLRMAKGVSARYVAGKLGIGATMLCHLEKGRRVWKEGTIKAFEGLFT